MLFLKRKDGYVAVPFSKVRGITFTDGSGKPVSMEGGHSIVMVDGFGNEIDMERLEEAVQAIKPTNEFATEVLETEGRLGFKAEDTVTGFTGIVTGECSYLTGCDQVGITAASHGGKRGETVYFDVNRVKFHGREIDVEAMHEIGLGGPQESPSS